MFSQYGADVSNATRTLFNESSPERLQQQAHDHYQHRITDNGANVGDTTYVRRFGLPLGGRGVNTNDSYATGPASAGMATPAPPTSGTTPPITEAELNRLRAYAVELEEQLAMEEGRIRTCERLREYLFGAEVDGGMGGGGRGGGVGYSGNNSYTNSSMGRSDEWSPKRSLDVAEALRRLASFEGMLRSEVDRMVAMRNKSRGLAAAPLPPPPPPSQHNRQGYPHDTNSGGYSPHMSAFSGSAYNNDYGLATTGYGRGAHHAALRKTNTMFPSSSPLHQSSSTNAPAIIPAPTLALTSPYRTTSASPLRIAEVLSNDHSGIPTERIMGGTSASPQVGEANIIAAAKAIPHTVAELERLVVEARGTLRGLMQERDSLAARGQRMGLRL